MWHGLLCLLTTPPTPFDCHFNQFHVSFAGEWQRGVKTITVSIEQHQQLVRSCGNPWHATFFPSSSPFKPHFHIFRAFTSTVSSLSLLVVRLRHFFCHPLLSREQKINRKNDCYEEPGKQQSVGVKEDELYVKSILWQHFPECSNWQTDTSSWPTFYHFILGPDLPIRKSPNSPSHDKWLPHKALLLLQPSSLSSGMAPGDGHSLPKPSDVALWVNYTS